jgi:Carboxypeptidase regulatory-like domain
MLMIVRNVCCFALFTGLLLCMPTHAAAQTYFAGTVVDGNSQLLAGVTIDAGHVLFQIDGEFILDGQGTTNAQGQYAITTLGAGDGLGKYVLMALLAGHIAEIYPNTPCDTCPDRLVNFPNAVAAPNLSANFQLLRPGSISGHVTRTDTNANVSDAFVLLLQQGGVLTGVTADSSGRFAFRNLLPGSYELSEQSYQAADQQLLLPQAYAAHDYDSTLPTPAGDEVVLAEGQDLAGIDFAVNIGAAIEGVITSALNGAPLQTQVNIRRLTPVDSGPDYDAQTTSGGYANPVWGVYQLAPLLPGTFKVRFGSAGFAPQFYPGVSDEALAQTIAVSNAQVVTGIDAQVTPLQTIAGTATDAATGLPLAGALVHAGPTFSITLLDEVDAITDAAGHYLLQGLTPTDPGQPQFYYYVWIYSFPGYLNTFYPNAPAACCPGVGASAQKLALSASQQLTGIDLALSAGAYATGRIYDPDTGYTAPAGMEVDLLDSIGNFVEGGYTDGTGHYMTDATPTGNYYLATSLSASTIFYPNYFCTYPDCQPANAQLLNFSVAQEYPNLDFAFHLDLVFRGNFDH